MKNTLLGLLSYKITLMILISLGTILLFSNCEGECYRKGIVYDIETRDAIDSVKCFIVTTSRTIYTDNKGKYSFIVQFGGFQTDCPDIVVEFSKEGYKVKEVTNLKQEDIIYLEKD